MDLTPVDPAVAGQAFARDLERLWDSGRPVKDGWTRSRLDDLTEVVQMAGRTPSGECDAYYLRLNASYYGPHPPQVTFVEPETWHEASDQSRWLPRLENPPNWFALHPSYGYPGGTARQLVCFSFNLDYYRSNHSPQRSEVWVQGRHTVAATLNRIFEVLGPAYYRGPMAAIGAGT